MSNLKPILVFILLVFNSKGFSQKCENPKIEIGIAARDELHTLVDGSERRSFYYFQGVSGTNSIEFTGLINATGPRVLFNVIQKLPGKNNLSISLSNSISLYSERSLKKYIIDPSDAYTKRYKRDHFIDLVNNFKTKNKTFDVVIALGVGQMNCGTKFKIRGNINSGFTSSATIGTDRVSASRFQLGIQKKPFKMLGLLYFIGRENLGYPKILLEWKLTYTISPFAKKRHVFELPKFKFLQHKK